MPTFKIKSVKVKLKYDITGGTSATTSRSFDTHFIVVSPKLRKRIARLAVLGFVETGAGKGMVFRKRGVTDVEFPFDAQGSAVARNGGSLTVTTELESDGTPASPKVATVFMFSKSADLVRNEISRTGKWKYLLVPDDDSEEYFLVLFRPGGPGDVSDCLQFNCSNATSPQDRQRCIDNCYASSKTPPKPAWET